MGMREKGFIEDLYKDVDSMISPMLRSSSSGYESQDLDGDNTPRLVCIREAAIHSKVGEKGSLRKSQPRMPPKKCVVPCSGEFP